MFVFVAQCDKLSDNAMFAMRPFGKWVLIRKSKAESNKKTATNNSVGRAASVVSFVNEERLIQNLNGFDCNLQQWNEMRYG